MPERPSIEGISHSLAPLRDVVASLAAARTGTTPAGTDRRRIVRRVKAAGVAALPALVRSLGSVRSDEARWASYLLARLGGARVVERVSHLLEDPRLTEEARARAIALLHRLSRGVDEPVLVRSVRDLLDGIETEEDVAQAAGLIVRQVPERELPAFAGELARHGGDQAAPLLEALLAAGELSTGTRDAIARATDRDGGACPERTLRRSDPRARGLDLLERGRFAASRRLLERVVADQPDDGEALSFLGVCCLEMGDARAALPHLERASALEPAEPLHQWNLAAAAKAARQLGRCYFALVRYLELGDAVEGCRGRRREARGFVREYEQSLGRSYPGVPLADLLAGERLFAEAYAALEAERFRDAAAGFERVLALVPGHYPSWGNLGAARFAEGRPDEAARCLRRALELKPDYEVARENLRRIDDVNSR